MYVICAVDNVKLVDIVSPCCHRLLLLLLLLCSSYEICPIAPGAAWSADPQRLAAQERW